jgi:hypothetical protein
MSEPGYDRDVTVPTDPAQQNGGISFEDHRHRDESSIEKQAATIFLWLTTLSILGAIYVYQVGDIWTLILVMCASLFLGLFTFAMMLTAD